MRYPRYILPFLLIAIAVGQPAAAQEDLPSTVLDSLSLFGSSSVFSDRAGDGADLALFDGDRWGESLAAGNFRGLANRGRPSDLVVGAPSDTLAEMAGALPVPVAVDAGSVQVLQGSGVGLQADDAITFDLRNSGLDGDPAAVRTFKCQALETYYHCRHCALR